MNGKQIIINANISEEIRIAITEKNKLLDLNIEMKNRSKYKGNVYKGIVSNTEDSLEAAFIEFGEKKQGFLPLSEIRPCIQLFNNHEYEFEKIKVSSILKKGQEIIIQVTKDAISSKGAALSTYISIPGRYTIIMHSNECNGGVSKKINNEKDKKFAKTLLKRIYLSSGVSIIIRTAGINCSLSNFLRDFRFLCESWKNIQNDINSKKAPALIYEEPNIIIKTIRDYFSLSINKIIVDKKKEYKEIKNHFNKYIPNLNQILEIYSRKEPIFQKLGVENEIEQLSKRKIELPSGGALIIEQTEALVAIDVNSGKSNREEDQETTAYKTNAEASYEISRQLRLRDLGGIIIIDFIDMGLKKHKTGIERKIMKDMEQDKAKIKISHITDNGTLELTRQRLRQSHRLISHVLCENCNGTGRVHDIQGLSVSALRKISTHISNSPSILFKIEAILPTDIANFLNNEKRINLLNISNRYRLKIIIIGSYVLKNYDIKIIEEKKECLPISKNKKNKKNKNNNHSINKQDIFITLEIFNKHRAQFESSITDAPVFDFYIKNNTLKNIFTEINLSNIIDKTLFGLPEGRNNKIIKIKNL